MILNDKVVEIKFAKPESKNNCFSYLYALFYR